MAVIIPTLQAEIVAAHGLGHDPFSPCVLSSSARDTRFTLPEDRIGASCLWGSDMHGVTPPRALY